jgi:hypothetical protein
MLYVFVGLLLTVAVVMGVVALSTQSSAFQSNDSAHAEHERSRKFFDAR